MTEQILLTNPSEALVSANTSSGNKSLTIEDLTKILGSTVKHDDANKVITFLGMLLTYTEEDQINIGFLAESSTGKSYIALEISRYFPEEDIIKCGYASPTAFFHDHALIRNDESETFLVDLHQKILIFMDQPHDMLLQRLRPLLSHDEKTVKLMITDRNKNKNLRTKHVLVKGYPTVVFASAKFRMEDQEKTRLLLLSPEVTQEKLSESIVLKIERESDRQAFMEELQNNPERRFLVQRVQDVKKAAIKHVIISKEQSDKIRSKFMKKNDKLIPRHMRDISRLLSMIKANALLNFCCRERIGDSIVVTPEDIDVGFGLYENVSEANEMGLSPEIFDIYVKLKPYIAKNALGITINDYQAFYEMNFYRRVNYDTARETLKTLANMSLLIEETDMVDKRIKRYLLSECVQKTETSTQ